MGYSCLGCPVSFCSGFNISLLIEQPSLLLYNNGNFDPGSFALQALRGKPRKFARRNSLESSLSVMRNHILATIPHGLAVSVNKETPIQCRLQ